jgi:chaperonin GroES
MRRDAMKLVPLDDRVVIQRMEAEATSPGGIVLPDAAKEKPQKGKVIAVGAGKVLDDGTRAGMDVTVDDTVLFSKYAGTEVTIDGEEYLIMRDADVLAVLK